MESIVDKFTEAVGVAIPNVVAAAAILVVGWIFAAIVAAVVRRVLHRTSLDDRLAAWALGEEKAAEANVEKAGGKIAFWRVFVFVGVFETLGLSLITQPLNEFLNQLFAFAPQLLGAALLIVAAWAVAGLVRMVVSKGLKAARLDERVAGESGEGVEPQAVPLASTIGETAYWLVFLLFLPAILGTLSLGGLLEPVQTMLDKVLSFFPNIATAAFIVVVGWFVARIVQRIVTNLLAAVGADRLSDSVGLDKALGTQKLSRLIGLIVYILVLLPVIIAALNTLQLEAVSGPASNMLNLVLEAIPAIFAAALVIAISYVVGKTIAGLVSNLLAGIGFDRILLRLGLADTEAKEASWKPSSIAGSVVLVSIMLFSAMEAFSLLGFVALAALISEFLFFAGHVAMGLIIFGLALYLSELVARAVRGSGVVQANLLAMVAKISIVVLGSTMALRQMGLANDIVAIGFGLVLGALAIAAAVAFGVGGRHIAARELEKWVDSLKSEE